MGMTEPIASDLKKLEEGMVMYDSGLDRDVLVFAPVIAALADNPRHSEMLNHLGSGANLYCRICMVNKRQDPSQLSTYRTKELADFHMQCIRNQPHQTGRAASRTKFGMKEDNNPLFSLSVDLFRSTPVETLHTILLGSYKYLLKILIGRLTTVEKKELLARMSTVKYSGFKGKVLGNIVFYHKSFVGRDYKAWAQLALFVSGPYLSDGEKVFRIAYCLPFSEADLDRCTEICQQFVTAVKEEQPEMLQKQKVHLLLDLPHCMKEFGPTSCFNTERCESFNSLMRSHNIYSNKAASSRDIACSFAVLHDIRLICDGGMMLHLSRNIGLGLVQLYQSKHVQDFVNGKTRDNDKAIFQPGALRQKVKESKPLHEVEFDIDGHAVTLGTLPPGMSVNGVPISATGEVNGAAFCWQSSRMYAVIRPCVLCRDLIRSNLGNKH